MTAAALLPGLDLDRLSTWFVGEAGLQAAPLSARLIAGGRSNLTYEVTDGESVWILRRPPLGHILTGAHDMAREHRVMSALRGTAVPVPSIHAICSDASVMGAPFYLMERVEGTPYRNADELKRLGPSRTRSIALELVDTLATLHQVDPGAIGLTGFGRPEGFLERQLRLWKKQLDASYRRDLPAADELYRRLVVAVPRESAARIVHGDYRLDNLLVDDNDRATALLDWEMATLGDPLTDLALMVLYQRLGDELRVAVGTDAATAPGFLTEQEVLDRYAGRVDHDLSGFGFYLGLAAFKLSAIVEGIHYRYLHGQTVGGGFDRVGDAIHAVLDAGLTALKEYS